MSHVALLPFAHVVHMSCSCKNVEGCHCAENEFLCTDARLGKECIKKTKYSEGNYFAENLRRIRFWSTTVKYPFEVLYFALLGHMLSGYRFV